MADKPRSQVDQLAEEIARSHILREAIEQAMAVAIPLAMRAVLRDRFPGETVRLYCATTDLLQVQQRNERIAQALAGGADPNMVAKTEGVTPRGARKIRSRLRGTIGP